MTLTTTDDLFVPEVWADTAAPLILKKAVLAGLATVDDELVGRPGETVIFPKWAYIGDADDLTEGVAMNPVKMSQTDSRATIKEAGKAVELTDSALLSAIGDPSNQAQQQLATSIARKIDTDLRGAAELIVTGSADPENPNTSPLVVGTAAPLSWDRLVAGFGLFGDEYNPQDMAGIVVHSRDYGTLMLDPNFLSADKFGAGAVIQRGQIGSIGTIPVFVSDRATSAAAGTDTQAGTADDTYNTLLIRKGALALKYKRRPLVERDRDILTRTNIITTNAHYAVKRVDDRGVVVIPTTPRA